MFDQIVNEYIKSLGSPEEIETLHAQASDVGVKIALQDRLLAELTKGRDNDASKLAENQSGPVKWRWNEQLVAGKRAKIANLQTRIDAITRQKSFVQNRDALLLEQQEILLLLRRIETMDVEVESRDDLVPSLRKALAANQDCLASIERDRHEVVVDKLSRIYAENGEPPTNELAVGSLQLVVLQLERPGGPPDDKGLRASIETSLHQLAGSRETLNELGMADAVAGIEKTLGIFLAKLNTPPVEKADLGEGAEEDHRLRDEVAKACREARGLIESAMLRHARSTSDKVTAHEVVAQALRSFGGDKIGELAGLALTQLSRTADSVVEIERRIDDRLKRFDELDRQKPEKRAELIEAMDKEDREIYLPYKEAKMKFATSANEFVQNYFILNGGSELVRPPVRANAMADGEFLAATNSAVGDYNDPRNLGKYTYHLTALGNLIRGHDAGISRTGLQPQLGGTKGGSSEIADRAKFMKESIQEASYVNSENKVAVSSNRAEGTKVYIKQREDKVDSLMAGAAKAGSPKPDDNPEGFEEHQQLAAEAARATSVMLRFPIRAEYLGKFGKDPIHLKDNLELLDGTPVPADDIEVLVHRQWVSITDQDFLLSYAQAMGGD